MNELNTAAEFLPLEVDLSGASTVVSAYPAILRGIWVSVDVSGGLVSFTNNSVQVLSVPDASSGGQWLEFGDNFFTSDITVDSSAVSTGKITVVYKPVPANA